MAATSVSTRRSYTMPIAVAAVCGAICFLAGRYSVGESVAPSALQAGRDGTALRSSGDASANKSVSPVAETSGRSAASTSLPTWDNRPWRELLLSPGSPARNAALAELLEQLAAARPALAMTLAQAEGNLKLREKLVQAALRGWARTAPADAANWALALRGANERESALSAVFTGAVATDPAAAVRLGQSLVQQNPTDASGYGARLIDALCVAGKFDTAAQMAASGDRETRVNWMAKAYSKWAEFQPERAASAAAALADPELRTQALHGIVGGWAAVDPVALVNFVVQLPPDAEQGALLSQSLEYWVKLDPKNAAAWIDQNENRPELDRGMAAVATMEAMKSDVALSWAESISNPALRSETLVTVVRNWMTADLPAARNYFKTCKNLLPADRQQLDEVFAGMDSH